MILKQEILSLAKVLQLQPTTLEKDYVLSWVLFGISQNVELSAWLFKGGTCLKKCYFETYRFSEDLDFTVPKGAIYDEKGIKNALDSVASLVYEEAGIDLVARESELKASFNKKGQKTYIAKYTYTGPLALPSRNQQRIKFDITDDEIIVDEPKLCEVFHRYSDTPKQPAKIRCYSLNEIVAEKTRAIYERQGRARDIYDIVNISRSFRQHVDPKIARIGLQKKFDFKSLPNPTVDLILSSIDFPQLEASWKDQLEHQLEVLPPAKSIYDDLKSALAWWIDEHPIEPLLTSISNDAAETRLPRMQFPESATNSSNELGIGRQANISFSQNLEQIRYAGRNRLCVEIEYHGYKRLVEPYSLRQPKTNNILLYAYELERGASPTNKIKAYKLNEIATVLVKQKPFRPRFIVEL